MDSPSPSEPDHIAEIIRVTARLHADHHKSATASQHELGHLVDLLGRPGFIALLLLAGIVWTGGNSLAPAFGVRPLDPPPFPWLELAASLAALWVTMLIVTTQRCDDQPVSRGSR